MARRKDSPQKAAMREMMRDYLKNNDISIKDGTDVEYGARPLKRTIQKELEDPISELILQGGLKDKKVLHVGKDDKDKLTFKAE